MGFVNNLNKEYQTYLELTTKLCLSHNEEVMEAEIPSHWKPSGMMNLTEILSKENFTIKIQDNNELWEKWVKKIKLIIEDE